MPSTEPKRPVVGYFQDNSGLSEANEKQAPRTYAHQDRNFHSHPDQPSIRQKNGWNFQKLERRLQRAQKVARQELRFLDVTNKTKGTVSSFPRSSEEVCELVKEQLSERGLLRSSRRNPHAHPARNFAAESTGTDVSQDDRIGKEVQLPILEDLASMYFDIPENRVQQCQQVEEAQQTHETMEQNSTADLFCKKTMEKESAGNRMRSHVVREGENKGVKFAPREAKHFVPPKYPENVKKGKPVNRQVRVVPSGASERKASRPARIADTDIKMQSGIGIVSHHQSKASKNSGPQRQKSKDFIVEPPVRTIGKSKTGLKVHDRRVDAANAWQMKESDQRLQRAYEKMLREAAIEEEVNNKRRKRGRHQSRPAKRNEGLPISVNLRTELQRFLDSRAGMLDTRKSLMSGQSSPPPHSNPKSDASPDALEPPEGKVQLQTHGETARLEQQVEVIVAQKIEPLLAKALEDLEHAMGRISSVPVTSKSDVQERAINHGSATIETKIIRSQSPVATGVVEDDESRGLVYLLSKLRELEVEGERLLHVKKHDTAEAHESAQVEDDVAPQQPAELAAVRPRLALSIPPDALNGIEDGRMRYIRHQRAAIGALVVLPSGDEDFTTIADYIDPWNTVQSIADELLDEILQGNASEIVRVADDFVERLFDEEFEPEI
ncbi:hypothetical protein, variant 1 [Spizellomyces punctatus DAOM BR117]|uniref:Uncharacterized protein n=1 Tax=Spizellomyces punctatus (strain DAOM BR117) TaxID=645134 RepID=A0A0L0H8X8_SPIPD|nr:hypothetical protein, variant 1 [Spizellomyces punctatus DAOM BR117]KNC97990.1 hypothetical protein, variant 1 [Spizellomyces punctatus DAOM BR117]|eukprot:XP_016606030.1 hypothetical protein, variant 1 [Spizellomyces punctatus DAOM BR117]